MAYSRPPSADEAATAEDFLQRQEEVYRALSDRQERVWTDFCQMILASNAFMYVD